MIVIPVVLFPSPTSLESSPVDSLAVEEPQSQVPSVYGHEVRVAGPVDRDSVL